MKLLVISGATFADPATRGSLAELAASGMQVTLALPRQVIHDFAPREVPEAPASAPGVAVVRLPMWYPHRNGTHIVFRGLRRLLRETQPDVVHCVMEPWSMTCLQLCAILQTLPRTPLFGLHPCESKPEQGGVLSRAIRTRLYRRVLARCDYFIGWSGVVVSAARRMGLNGIPISSAPPVGVDAALFTPADAGEKAHLRAEIGLPDLRGAVLGYVGRFVEEKGLRDLVAAADAAVSSSPGMHVALLGDGPLLGFLEEARRTRPWLSLHSRRDQVGVARFMRALDALVLPSKTTPHWEEQFGLVLSEAMACGLPVIGSSCGAIPEVIGQGGYVFPEGDIAALGSALLKTAAEGQSRPDMAARSRHQATSRYSAAAIADAVARTIRRAASETHR